MKTIGAFEAKTRFSELLRQVEAGESFEIQRRNKPVARLVSVRDESVADRVADMVARVRERRTRLAPQLGEIIDWIEEGRR